MAIVALATSAVGDTPVTGKGAPFLPRLARSAGKRVPPVAARLLRGQPLTIVTYHSISHEVHDYSVTPETFRRQLDLLRSAYPIIRLQQAAAVLAEAGDIRRLVVTFDDAYTNFVENAYPVLREFSVPCTLFVPTRYIGGWNEWEGSDGSLPKARIMDSEQIREVVASGIVDVGSHTVDHASMRGLPKSEMRRQAVQSQQTLETLLGRPVRAFAYPYGGLDNHSPATARVLAEAGYVFGLTTRWGSKNSLKHLLDLKRISFSEADGDADLRAKVEGDYDWRAAKEWGGFALRHLRRQTTGRFRS